MRIQGDIWSAIEALECRSSLWEKTSFAARLEAIDFLEFHVIDLADSQPAGGEQDSEWLALRRRATSLRDTLEAINDCVFKRFQDKIASGNYERDDLLAEFGQYIDAPQADNHDDVAYQNLDLFVNGLLKLDFPIGELCELDPDMVAYQPTPARLIFELIRKVDLGPDDVFFDIGSGLGQVAILVALLTGATTKGVEFQPVYCDYSRRCVQRLKLSGVEFINQDARRVDYSTGTVFYMYTPFRGEMLNAVLKRLRCVAQQRVIRLCTYGPCTPEVAEQGWLIPTSGDVSSEQTVVVFEIV
jgi:hypothetical protein